MATKTRTELKAFFETGDKPTAAQFTDLINGIPNLQDAGGTPSQLYFIRKTLTAAEIKTGNSVPVDIGIPVPAAGKAIHLHAASVKYTYGTAAFTSTQVRLRYSSLITNVIATSAAASIFTQVVNIFIYLFGQAAAAGLNQLAAADTIVFTTNADSIVGDGTAVLYVWYSILDV